MSSKAKQKRERVDVQSRVISMRLIVTTVAVLLISAAVLGGGAIAERNARQALTESLETRLVLEVRGLATVSSSALLTDFPELTLHPLIKEMKTQRPDLGLVYVVDHRGVIQGHSDAKRLGTEYSADQSLAPRESRVVLTDEEALLANDDLLVIRKQILHPNGSPIGYATVGLKRSHAEAAIVAARRNQIVFLLPLLAVSILLTMVLMSRLLHPLSKIRSAIEKIGHGDLDSRVEVSSRTELGLVAQSINDMAGQLKIAQEELLDKERLDHEMQLAYQIQRSLLPKDAMQVGNIQVLGAQQAAAEVGGDYYDTFSLPDGRVGVVVADVAGKGLAGCLVTSMLAVLIRTLRTSYASPSDLIFAVNEGIVESLRPGTFITMFYGLIDPGSGQLTFASAGHNPLLHYRAASRDASWHKTGGVPVGLVSGEAIRETLTDGILYLQPGDRVVLTTDGFNEAVNPDMTEFGFERVAEKVCALAHEDAPTIIGGIQNAVDTWEAGLPAIDDKTLVVISQMAIDDDQTSVTNDDTHRQLPADLAKCWSDRTRGNFLAGPAQLDLLQDLNSRVRRCPGLETFSDVEFGMVEQGLYEVLANTIEHGCLLDRSKTIDVWWFADSGRMDRGVFLIRDHGLPPAPHTWAPMNSTRPKGRGYGLQIIERTLPEVESFASTPDGNLTAVFVVLAR